MKIEINSHDLSMIQTMIQCAQANLKYPESNDPYDLSIYERDKKWFKRYYDMVSSWRLEAAREEFNAEAVRRNQTKDCLECKIPVYESSYGMNMNVDGSYHICNL